MLLGIKSDWSDSSVFGTLVNGTEYTHQITWFRTEHDKMASSRG